MTTMRDAIASPDDLDVRLRLADAIEGEDPDLAAFIRNGVALARLPPHGSRARLERSQRVLYRKRARAALVDPLPWLSAPWLHGGLVEGGTIDAADLMAHAEDRFSALPLRHLVLRDAAGRLPAILAAPWLSRLVSLELRAAKLDDQDALRIAESPAVAGLRWLGLADNAITTEGIEALAASAHLRSLQVLDLAGNPAPPVGREPISDDGQVIGYAPNGFAAALEERYGRRPWLGRTDPVLPCRTRFSR